VYGLLNQNNYGTLNEFKEQIVRQSEMDYLFTWGGNVGIELGYNFHKHWGSTNRTKICMGRTKIR
jgi:hypothetical protein